MNGNSKSDSNIVITLLLIILFVVVGGLIYYYMEQKKDETPSTTTKETKVVVVPTGGGWRWPWVRPGPPPGPVSQCRYSRWGCCPDGRTPRAGPKGKNC